LGELIGIVDLIFGAVGGIGAVLIAVSTGWGRRFVDHQFDKRIEKVKSGLEADIERLKAKLAHLGDRGIRSNEREYAAIIASWVAFVEAYLATNRCVARLDEFADLSKKGDDEFDEWAENIRLPADIAASVKTSKDRNRAYGRYLQWKAISEALRLHYDARQCVRKQGIFIPQELETQFLCNLDLISQTLAGRRAEFDNRATETTAKWTSQFLENGPASYEALKNAARERMMYDAANAEPAAEEAR
jgi:hypothetical protein